MRVEHPVHTELEKRVADGADIAVDGADVLSIGVYLLRQRFRVFHPCDGVEAVRAIDWRPYAVNEAVPEMAYCLALAAKLSRNVPVELDIE